MKKIFKKNQIIITALAVMIAIAGFLNFTQRNQDDLADENNKSEVVDYDTDDKTASDKLEDSDLVDLIKEGTDLENILDSDNQDKGQQVSDTGELVVDSQTEDTDQTDVGASGQGGKEDSKDQGTPGEAILVSTTASPDYFINSRVEREQMRAKNKEILMEILENTNVSEADKSKATQEIINLTAISEKENSTESLLEAKGYSDAFVRITDKGVNVIVNAASLTEQEVAQIEDITKRETGADISEIVIAPVVVTDWFTYIRIGKTLVTEFLSYFIRCVSRCDKIRQKLRHQCLIKKKFANAV